MEKNTCCKICMKEFFKVSNLRRHTKKFHPELYEPLPDKKFAFTCEVCGKNFSYIRNYRSHKKSHDPNPIQNKKLKKCPLCNFNSEKWELCDHFEKFHDIELITEEIDFQNFENFMKWKMSMESDEINFIRGYSQQTKYYDEVVLFVCHRSGHHLPKAKGYGKLKNEVVTKKIGGFCPASVRMMKKKDGCIKVSFQRTHVGHDNDETISKRDSSKRVKTITSRHKLSLALFADALVKYDDTWQYRSPDKSGIFTVSRNETKCEENCPYRCEDCNSCVHKYSCSCRDWSTKWNMCVHIHLLCRTLNESSRLHVKEQASQEANSNIDITDLIIYDAENNDHTTRQVPEVQGESTSISVEEKNVILQEFSDILIKCQSTTFFQEIVTIVDELKARIECEEFITPDKSHYDTR